MEHETTTNGAPRASLTETAQVSPGSPENGVDTRIAARDGRPLAATVFRPAGPPGLSVVVGGAMAVARGFYADFARALSSRGALVVTFDFRGMGGSRSRRIQDEPATLT